MGRITADIAQFIKDMQLCYVATVSKEGRPNLSPKGSLTAYGEDQLLFANIASPQTAANLLQNPAIEINVVDIFRRRGYRFTGTAALKAKGTEEFDIVAIPLWETHGDAFPVFDVVSVHVEAVREVKSPAYSFGKDASEASLSEAFSQKYLQQYGDSRA